MARAYDRSGRDAAARETRARIVATARRMLLDGGYAKMRIADLARAADVAPQTVYNAIGGKAEVVKAVYDVVLAGDDDSTPMSERPEFRRIAAATDIAEFAHAYAGWSRQIYERVGPLLGALLAHGAGGDPLLENLVATIERERRQGNTNGLTGLARQVALPDGPARERLIDAMWTLTSPEVYNRLVGRGWTGAQYERWLGDQLTAALSST